MLQHLYQAADCHQKSKLTGRLAVYFATRKRKMPGEIGSYVMSGGIGSRLCHCRERLFQSSS